jgi:hypothetical protein
MESLHLFRELEDTWSIADTLSGLGMVVVLRGDYERSAGLLEESLSLFQQLEDDGGIAQMLLLPRPGSDLMVVRQRNQNRGANLGVHEGATNDRVIQSTLRICDQRDGGAIRYRIRCLPESPCSSDGVSRLRSSCAPPDNVDSVCVRSLSACITFHKGENDTNATQHDCW